MAAGSTQEKLFNTDSLLSEHGDYLFHFAFVRLRSQTAAEDIVQETLLAAVRGRDSFEGRSSVRTWLVGIAKFKVLEYIRKSSREAPAAEDSVEESVVSSSFDRLGLWNKNPAGWGCSPEDLFGQKEFLIHLQQCLSALSEKARLAFTMHTVDQIEPANICEALSITESNLWVHLHRARLALRDCLERHGLGRGK